MSGTRHDWSVILLTGGTARRLHGADKAMLDLAGTTPLAMVLDSVPPDVPVIVAGDPIPTPRPVTFCREDPPGGGPAAGIASALPWTATDLVGLLAVDMPWSVPILESAVTALRDSAADVVVPIDGDGRRQLLCSAWRTEALRQAVTHAGDLSGRPVRDLLTGVGVLELPHCGSDDLADIDTPEDLSRARDRAHRQAPRP